mmetsp:Transcript_107183/g.284167  ORF Transcript_107183/g.284167 Transcript_107183/m.284167 type:complete len:209 (-) Transcript_107183:13-639(-)
MHAIELKERLSNSAAARSQLALGTRELESEACRLRDQDGALGVRGCRQRTREFSLVLADFLPRGRLAAVLHVSCHGRGQRGASLRACIEARLSALAVNHAYQARGACAALALALAIQPSHVLGIHLRGLQLQGVQHADRSLLALGAALVVRGQGRLHGRWLHFGAARHGERRRKHREELELRHRRRSKTSARPSGSTRFGSAVRAKIP